MVNVYYCSKGDDFEFFSKNLKFKQLRNNKIKNSELVRIS